jgi:hypothetical protein
VRHDLTLLIRSAREAGDQRLANLIVRRMEHAANRGNGRSKPTPSGLALRTLERLALLFGLEGDSG